MALVDARERGEPVELVAIPGERPARAFAPDGAQVDLTGQADGRRRSELEDSNLLDTGRNTDG